MIEVNGLQINVMATLLAMVTFFLLGFFWYGKLFARPWTREMGYDPNKRPGTKHIFKGVLILLISSFMFCWVLSFYFAGWRLLPGSPTEFGTAAFAINCALSVMIGFFIPLNLSRVAWEKHSWKLFFIHTGYHSTGTLLVSFILASA